MENANKVDDFEALKERFNLFKNFYDENAVAIFDESESGIHKFISEYKAMQDEYFEEDKKFAREYNIFKILNIGRPEENIHSPFLKSLLDCNGEHRQGDFFYRLFIETILENNADSNAFFLDNPKEYYIKSEEYIKNSDGQIGRIDIFIKSLNPLKKFVIIIENKWDSGDSCDNQIYKYYTHYEKEKDDQPILIIYLTKHGGLPSINTGKDYEGFKKFIKDEHNKTFFTISYKKEVVDWLEKSKNEHELPQKIETLISQYITLIKNDYDKF